MQQPTIQECVVTVPLTSEEVRDMAAEAIRFNSPLVLVLLPEQDIPPPEPIELVFPLHSITRIEGNRLKIDGENEDYSSIVIRTDSDDKPAAHASLVIS